MNNSTFRGEGYGAVKLSQLLAHAIPVEIAKRRVGIGLSYPMEDIRGMFNAAETVYLLSGSAYGEGKEEAAAKQILEAGADILREAKKIIIVTAYSQAPETDAAAESIKSAVRPSCAVCELTYDIAGLSEIDGTPYESYNYVIPYDYIFWGYCANADYKLDMVSAAVFAFFGDAETANSLTVTGIGPAAEVLKNLITAVTNHGFHQGRHALNLVFPDAAEHMATFNSAETIHVLTGVASGPDKVQAVAAQILEAGAETLRAGILCLTLIYFAQEGASVEDMVSIIESVGDAMPEEAELIWGAGIMYEFIDTVECTVYLAVPESGPN